LEFNVNPSVLIPRPETEHLVERALAWLADHPACRRAVDVCTGSGCIAVTLAVKVPHLHFWATDISTAALAVARSNAKRHTVTEQITFLQADLLAGITTHFDLICANPPYIPSADVPATGEPRLALDGGADGMDVICRLLEQAKSHLSSPGMLLMEIEARQGKRVLDMAKGIFPQAQITCHPDLAGWDRIIEINLARF
jgi:release factor glutamine methyltransferase